MVLQATTIRTEINKAGVLWGAHIRPILTRARYLSSGRNHRGSTVTLQLRDVMQQLNQAYSDLLYNHDYSDQNSDKVAHGKLSSMRSQVDLIKTYCDTLTTRWKARLELFTNQVKQALTQKCSEEELLASIRTLCKFVDKLIMRHKIPRVDDLGEAYLRIRSACGDLHHLGITAHQTRFAGRRDLDNDHNGVIKKALTEELPRLVREFIHEIKKGVESWYQEACKSYEKLLTEASAIPGG